MTNRLRSAVATRGRTTTALVQQSASTAGNKECTVEAGTFTKVLLSLETSAEHLNRIQKQLDRKDFK